MLDRFMDKKNSSDNIHIQIYYALHIRIGVQLNRNSNLGTRTVTGQNLSNRMTIYVSNSCYRRL